MVNKQVAFGALFAALVQGCADRSAAQADGEGSAEGTSGDDSTTQGSTEGSATSTGLQTDSTLSSTDCGPGLFVQNVDVDAASVEGYGPGDALPLELCLDLCEQMVYESLECAVAIEDATGEDTGTSGAGESTGVGGSTDGGTAGDETAGDETSGGATTGATTGAGETVTIECNYTVTSCDSAGRRSAGLLPPGPAAGRDALGRYFAAMAHNEAASVVSFVRLQAELAAHGAPAELLERVRIAARDEVRHARAMRRLARAHGAEPLRPTHVDVAPRPLAEIARENAIEGCVTETWSALLCTWQARHSADPEIAGVLRQIAADETRHADLAWALAAWMRDRLDPATNASIDADRAAAAAALVPSIEIAMAPAARAALGLPPTSTAKLLASSLCAAMAA